MNNFRAGLYSFASTTTWLHQIGMASPPSLVILGLTLPDSRILNGVASIGLTLANIAIILPHLRQPVLDSIHAHACALADAQKAQEKICSSDDESSVTQLVDLRVENPPPASLLLCNGEPEGSSLIYSATVESVSLVIAESFDVDSQHAPRATPPLSTEETDDDQVPLQIHTSLGVGSIGKNVNIGHLLARRDRGPVYIPLPIPDAEEVAFFDTTGAVLSDRDKGDEYATTHCAEPVLEEHPTVEIDGRESGVPIEEDGQLVTSDLSSTMARLEICEDVTCVPVNENEASNPPNAIIGNLHILVTDSIVSGLSDGVGAGCGETEQTVQVGHTPTGEKAEALAKRRPESLEFIPQSVIRRYPSVSIASAGRCFGHDNQVTRSMSPHIFVHNPAMLLEGTRPRAAYTTFEGYWHASFLTDANSEAQGQNVVIETTQGQYSSHRRRLGVLARASLRNRRYRARCRDDAIDGSSTSDSDSESDSDSQSSSGSSADESILPHILGTDLIAAIDANSESGLNLAGTRRAACVALHSYEDFLISDDSAADVSMVMHVSSNDDTTGNDARIPANFRPLTREDIQRWASGVVQKCAGQACRSHAPAEPSSPSQTSDVCAERPSGSGISHCPLSGLHSKLGVATPAGTPAPRKQELPAAPPPTSTPPTRKPMSVRNLRDVPEFVPRQRHVSVVTGRKLGTRATIDVTQDAATEVIARMESQAGFNTRQRPVGMDEKWMVGTSWQGTRRCA